MASVTIFNEVSTGALPRGGTGEWELSFQRCRWNLDEGIQYGFRFIWRRPDGSLQAARGQARLPSIPDMFELIGQAVGNGWGHDFVV